MNTTDRNIKELELAGLFDKDSDYNGTLGIAIKELLEVFQKQDHSGCSAEIVANLFYRLIKGENLTPLKGTPDEWVEVSDEIFQNKRNPAVFAKNKNGKDAYFTDGKIFKDLDGVCYTSNDSKVSLTFPCIPKSEYIEKSD